MLKLLFVLSVFAIANAKAPVKRSVSCNTNEILVECAHCGPKSCSELGYRSPCAGVSSGCKEQCACVDGFVRDASGLCVDKKECPSCGGDPNAISGCGNHCGNSCSDYTEANTTCLTGCRYNSCDCREGYVFDDERGKCVLPENCSKPPPCPTNETRTDCVPKCPPETCASIYSSYDCTEANKKPCVAGCKCKKGYLRIGLNGRCVKSEDCPPPTPSCPTNEHYVTNSKVCETSCADKDVVNIKECERQEPFTGCACNNGYFRDYDGNCVKREECPDFTCDGVNEIPSNCASGCATTCETRIRNNVICPAVCLKECVCKPDTLRHDNGTCVPTADCSPPKCNKDEVYKSCGTSCEDNCSNFNDTGRVCTKQCKEGCFCKKGLVRADDGITCINPKQCPSQTCGSNEHYVRNTKACETTCANKDIRYIRACERDQPFTGCVCDDGYLRDYNGRCILRKECPDFTCDGVNEIPSDCASGCATTCATRIRNNVICPAVCLKQCVCKPDTLRHDNGTCVYTADCSPPKCNKDEVYKSCGTSCEDTCSNFNDTNRICTDECKEGCFCQKGLVRADDGITCINPKKCPSQTCGSNEHYVRKTKACETTCANKDVIYKKACERSEPFTGCVCDDGYLRDYNGRCILRKECPDFTCDGVNEIPSNCASGCAPTCKTRIRNNVICPAVCLKECICKPDTYRHDNGTCVPAYECSPAQCNDDEEYSNCGSSCEDTCKNYNDTCRVCLAICREGCFCKKGLVRAADGITCINPKKCPVPKCGKNQVWDICPSNCLSGYCRDIWTRYNCDKALTCCTPKCVCKSGWYKNSKDVCVSLDTCMKTRGE